MTPINSLLMAPVLAKPSIESTNHSAVTATTCHRWDRDFRYDMSDGNRGRHTTVTTTRRPIVIGTLIDGSSTSSGSGSEVRSRSAVLGSE